MKTFNEVFATLPSHGWLAMEEAELLWKYTKEAKTVLEVGTYYGRSAAMLSEIVDTLYCVDPFVDFDTGDLSGENARLSFLQSMLDRGIIVGDGLNPPAEPTKVYLFKQKIENWEPRPVDLAYLDGDHSYRGTLRQINKALQCKPKFIAVHDVSNSSGGVHVDKACRELLGPRRELAGTMAVWVL